MKIEILEILQGLLHKPCKFDHNPPNGGATTTVSICTLIRCKGYLTNFSRKNLTVYVIVYLSECFVKILVNHVFSVLWTLEDTKKVVYIFYFRPNHVLASWQYMTMCSSILFLPVFLSTPFLQICWADTHQIWSRGVSCALEDPIKLSP